MEDEFKPSVQPQRRVNQNIKEAVKKEVIKLLDARLIYPISDSPWVSPVQVVPKKGEMTVVKNEKNELIPQRTGIGRHVCIDYSKLNNAAQKNPFPLPFIDQMLERLAEHEYYCFLDGFLGPLEEETALYKGWLRTSEYSVVGNARKEMGFWVETVRPKVASFCGVYANTIRTYTSGAGGVNYLQRALADYQVQYIVPFTHLHRREVLKQRDKLNSREVPEYLQEWKEKKNKGYKSSGSSSVNTKESGEGSINLNTIVGDRKMKWRKFVEVVLSAETKQKGKRKRGRRWQVQQMPLM
ncbi:hypothetical protein Tco_0976258 [Tanacetum coccineum]|uniref:Reverse transcriptase domain-containing protein n=1 Tax=Tanacetum coccineum TaxID=301880 RepID=A0ABQ5EGP9_9ASTR